MKYFVSIVSKIILFPIVILMLIPAYALFIISPDLHQFKFKMER